MTDNYLAVAMEIAREAGAILREEAKHPAQISYKREVDIVTQADKRSEKLIVERLTKYFPAHSIAAEEGTGHESVSEFRWHVDPLDGTTNFAHGYRCFCVSIALARQVPQLVTQKTAQQAQEQTVAPAPRDSVLCAVVY